MSTSSPHSCCPISKDVKPCVAPGSNGPRSTCNEGSLWLRVKPVGDELNILQAPFRQHGVNVSVRVHRWNSSKLPHAITRGVIIRSDPADCQCSITSRHTQRSSHAHKLISVLLPRLIVSLLAAVITGARLRRRVFPPRGFNEKSDSRWCSGPRNPQQLKQDTHLNSPQPLHHVGGLEPLESVTQFFLRRSWQQFPCPQTWRSHLASW